MSMFFSDIGHMHLFFIFSPKKMRDYGTFFPFIFHMSNLSVFYGHYAFVFLHMSIYSNFCGHYSFVFLYMSIFSNFCGHYSFIFCICPFARPQKNQELSLLILLHIFITLQHSMFHLVNFLCQFPDIRINMTGNQHNGTS